MRADADKNFLEKEYGPKVLHIWNGGGDRLYWYMLYSETVDVF